AAPRAGSNAWAAGGARTRDGHALLANDPHLDLTIPGLWYLEDLQAPGFHAAGASIPGTPGILLGHNERIAWGATNADAVANSLFAAPAALPASGWKRERFRVRFSREAVRRYYRTADAFGVPDPYQRGRLTLVRWPALFESHSAFAAFFALDRARSAAQAMRVLARYRGTAENFVVADSGGNVAYHLAGNVPRDPAWGRYVHPARDWGQHYSRVAFGQLPAIAPARYALVLSANNKMYGAGYPYRLSATFDPPYRAYRIAQLLHQRRRYDAAYFAAMQLDAVSPIDRAFARLLGARAAADDDAPAHARVARELRGWNGAFVPSSYAATVEHAVRARLEADAPSLPALLAQLRQGDGASGIAPDVGGALYAAGYETAPWGRAGAVRVEHPLAPLRFGFLNGATLPGNGDEYTIRLQEPGFSQSFRAVWEPGKWDAGGISIPSGESGEPGSGHYDDLSRAWIRGWLEPLPFSAAAVARATVDTLVLRPR
ncbi:MAG TPA: penicillin acylase family protein, partial [Candidatus Tumulicola sp.]|nr:penicillin acylase family protein [Candidatus Tumulicola sp.]